MVMADASIFHEILLGLRWLHSHDWLHGDIKPENIGIHLDRAVLLDIDTAIRVEPGCLVHPTPGSGGTIYYLAPEREMHAYNQLVDIWSLGVVGYELTYRQAPWRPRINPWRPGAEHEALRPMFKEQYNKAMSSITRDIDEATHKMSGDNLHCKLTSPFHLQKL
jgi:serine/threonine protein kinase